MEVDNFSRELQAALRQKQEWFNTECLQNLLLQYRLFHTCVKNTYDTFVKKSLIVPDPYRLDKRINDIVIPETTPFSESDLPKVFGARFSDYETMLDWICTYFRFTVENVTITKIKKLLDFNKVFEWDNLSTNSVKMNTRALALTLGNAKTGAPSVVQSMLNDNTNKCGQAIVEINKMLNELGVFQRELYKGELRKDLFEHPDFDKSKAFSSPEAELAEIKRLYVKIFGKKVFYNDLINEIIEEDQGPDKDKKQAATLEKLKIKAVVKTEEKKKTGPTEKELLMGIIEAIGAFAPTLFQLHSKLSENFNLLFQKKSTFWNKFIAALKKALNLKEKEKVCEIIIKDAKTGKEKAEKIKVNEFLDDLSKKERIYTGIANRGPEYGKIEVSSPEIILNFINKQISEIQTIFTLINALDTHFKTNVEVLLRPKVKGMQIELSALRNSIINANKKRGEYVSLKEESEQMKRLGITENE